MSKQSKTIVFRSEILEWVDKQASIAERDRSYMVNKFLQIAKDTIENDKPQK